MRADRELPVVWAVARGSLVNKAILVPAALAISALAPWAVTPLLMVGGAFLCYEGAEKLWHAWHHRDAGEAAWHAEHLQALGDPQIDLVALERDKIKGAVRTDLILSAEIIAITLGAVAASPLATQVAVLVAIALLMTVGVYGFVAGVVKLDDLGLYLSRLEGDAAAGRRALGRGILRAAPWLMKALSVVGTIAMFLVGGGILVHGVPALHHAVASIVAAPSGMAATWLAAVLPTLVDALTGLVVGAVVLLVVALAQRMRRPPATPA